LGVREIARQDDHVIETKNVLHATAPLHLKRQHSTDPIAVQEAHAPPACDEAAESTDALATDNTTARCAACAAPRNIARQNTGCAESAGPPGLPGARHRPGRHVPRPTH